VTEIAFHFGAPDKIGYVCRLLRKAVRQGHRVTVYTDPDDLTGLDDKLWAVSPVDFVAHCRVDAASTVRHLSPVVLASTELPVPEIRPMLVNVSQALPADFQQYARLIEVVSLDEADRAQARLRWKKYVQMGYTLIKHDLKLKGA
jgi:DNA polymerase III subunit chi